VCAWKKSASFPIEFLTSTIIFNSLTLPDSVLNTNEVFQLIDDHTTQMIVSLMIVQWSKMI
jgi:hypothetical protein